MNILDRRQRQLQKINDALDVSDRKIKGINQQITRLERKKKAKKLILAGLLFESAGILDKYDPVEILRLLRKYRDENADKGE